MQRVIHLKYNFRGQRSLRWSLFWINHKAKAVHFTKEMFSGHTSVHEQGSSFTEFLWDEILWSYEYMEHFGASSARNANSSGCRNLGHSQSLTDGRHQASSKSPTSFWTVFRSSCRSPAGGVRFVSSFRSSCGGRETSVCFVLKKRSGNCVSTRCLRLSIAERQMRGRALIWKQASSHVPALSNSQLVSLSDEALNQAQPSSEEENGRKSYKINFWSFLFFGAHILQSPSYVIFEPLSNIVGLVRG